MTIQVELNPEAQARLVAVAQAQGVPLEKEEKGTQLIFLLTAG